MANCLVDKGYSVGCDAKRQPGGLNRRLWIGNRVTDSGTLALTQTNNVVTNMTVPTYGGLYVIDAQKFAHQYDDPSVRTEGGNSYFNHTLIVRMIEEDGDDLELIKQLLGADIFAIVETYADKDTPGRFRVLGANNGMEHQEGAHSSGQTNESDISRSLNFQGADSDPALFFFDTDYATTLAAIEALEA